MVSLVHSPHASGASEVSYRILSLKNNCLLMPVLFLAVMPNRENSTKQLDEENILSYRDMITFTFPFHKYLEPKHGNLLHITVTW